MKHTPGPWNLPRVLDRTASSSGPQIGIIGFEVFMWPALHEKDNKNVRKETIEANARLIAAAPDMFEALKRLLQGIESPDALNQHFTDEAHKLVAKIELAAVEAEIKIEEEKKNA